MAVGDAMMKSDKVKLVTCFDSIPEKREAFSTKFGCENEESYEDVLRRDDIDGLHLATPNHLHAQQTLLAAQYGKHVFVEKPLCLTLEELEEIKTVYSSPLLCPSGCTIQVTRKV